MQTDPATPAASAPAPAPAPASPTRWTRDYIRLILHELAEDNPMACRAMLGISEVEFTDQVQTLAVTLTDPPRLRINLDFLEQHVRTEDEIRAVLLHEFLHVLLLHTQTYKRNTPLLNIALDATINAMIHRLFGASYSRLFRRMYYDEGVYGFLQPALNDEWPEEHRDMHKQILAGTISSQEFLEWLDSQYPTFRVHITLIGNHEGIGQASENGAADSNGAPVPGDLDGSSAPSLDDLPEPLREALGDLINGIRELQELASESAVQNGRSDGGEPEIIAVSKQHAKLAKWKSQTLRVINQCLEKDPRRAANITEVRDVRVPVLSGRDRRAAIQSVWNPIVPMARNPLSRLLPHSSVNIYLDVSGSMDDELPHLVSLLSQFSKQIRHPLWAFSTRVEPARLTWHGLSAATTGGTVIEPVFDHIRSQKSRRNLIITDGHVEQINPHMLKNLDIPSTHILVSANGSSRKFESHGFPCHQLKPLPGKEPQRWHASS